MNKGYVIVDDKVIVSDENGNYKETEFRDNLDEVLIQENVIEEMENKLGKLEKEIKKYAKVSKKTLKSIIIGCIIQMLLILSTPLVAEWMIGGNFFLTNPRFLMFIELFIGLPVSSIPFISNLYLYDGRKQSLNEKGAINSQIEFLKLELAKAKEKLATLQSIKTKNNVREEIRAKNVEDKEELERLKSYLKLYYDLGYNGEKYYRYYQQGNLNEKLKEDYNTEEIEMAKAYLKEKGTSLVKKY